MPDDDPALPGRCVYSLLESLLSLLSEFFSTLILDGLYSGSLLLGETASTHLLLGIEFVVLLVQVARDIVDVIVEPGKSEHLLATTYLFV